MVALADLKVLWSDIPQEYHQYARGVEQESMHRYHISLETYIYGRIEFLQTYIKQGFFPFLPNIDIKAIMTHNMKNEIQELSDFLRKNK